LFETFSLFILLIQTLFGEILKIRTKHLFEIIWHLMRDFGDGNP